MLFRLLRSLATTSGISVDFSSSPYLDVSVREVPHITLWIHVMFLGSSPRGFPHSEICGYNAYLQLPAAYRSLSRPSSAPDAKAFSMCSFKLDRRHISPLCGGCSSFPKNKGRFSGGPLRGLSTLHSFQETITRSP